MPPDGNTTAAQIAPRILRAGAQRTTSIAAVGLAALALVIVTTPAGVGAGVALVRVSGVALPIAVGLFELRRRPADRFAMLLVIAGSVWSLTTLGDSSDPTLYSIGRVSVWLVEPLLVVLLITFPYGRLASVVERRLTWTAVLVAGTLYVPTALLAEFPVPSPWTICGSDCPSNALLVTDAHGLVDGFIRPLREVLTVVVFTAIAVVLVRRATRSGELVRHMLVPVAVVAGVRALGTGFYFVARGTDPGSRVADVLGWMYVLSLPALTLAFAGGLLLQRLFVADALGYLTRGFDSHTGAPKLRATLARALKDPELQVVPRRSSPEAEPGPGRALTPVGDAGNRQFAIVHDAGLREDPELLESIVSYAGAALNIEQLNAELRASFEELSMSRARIVAVADDERRRIERDLHDGAQQRLVALGIKLELLAEGIEDEAPGTAKRVRELEHEVDTTLEEVRRFASGLYPPLLEDRGLEEALLAAARKSPVPATVDARLDRRFPREIESAVYFACVEALQNAAKHAHDAGRVSITVTENGALRFEVRDDGNGFDMSSTPTGAGLRNLKDRIEAVGGELRVLSGSGKGTRVRGLIPLH